MSEARDGKRLASWLEQRGLVFTHVANEGKRHPATAAHLKAQGLQPGFPDYIVFAKPQCAWELKAPGKKASKAQEAWLLRLKCLGWATGCGTIDEAIAFFKENYGIS